jgi:hypothetical protein
METASRDAQANSFQIHGQSVLLPRWPVNRVCHPPLTTDH